MTNTTQYVPSMSPSSSVLSPSVPPMIRVVPTATPTWAPMTIGTTDSVEDVSLLRFIVYTICTLLIAGFIVYLNRYVQLTLHLFQESNRLGAVLSLTDMVLLRSYH
jgi:hypothetical protein